MMALDPYALVQRIMQQVLSALTQDDAFTVQKGETPADQLADAIGNLLVEILMSEDSRFADSYNRSMESESDRAYADFYPIFERNGSLATAFSEFEDIGQPAEGEFHGCHWARPRWSDN